MNAAQLPDKLRFKLWAETVMTATYLNNLVIGTLNRQKETQWEHAGFKLPLWTKNLCTYGEAGTVKEGKRGKVLDLGVTMMFIGYNQENPENCFRMFNPESSRVTLTRDIIWLGWMYYPRQNAKVTQLLPIVAVPISQYLTNVEEENAAGIKIITEGPLISEEWEGIISDKSYSEKGEDSGWIVHRTCYGCPTGLKSGMYNLSTGKAVQWTDIATVSMDDKNKVTTNYYDILGINERKLEVMQNDKDEICQRQSWNRGGIHKHTGIERDEIS